jgi:hypothetical protein
MNKKIKLITKITLTIIISLISTQIINAQTITMRDVEIKIIIDYVDENVEYSQLFRVENLDHKTGTTDLLHFFINATLTKENETTTWNTTRSINKYTETGMGTIMLDKGKYELCVNLIPLNFHDYNLENNKDCKIIKTKNYFENITENITNNITENTTNIIDNTTNTYENTTNMIENLTEENNSTNNTINQTINMCDCSLEIITEKEIYDVQEKITFIIRDCYNETTFKNQIEYWAEDLFGDITKTKLETTSKAPKSYTPRITGNEKTFLLKAKIQTCNETTTKMIAVKGEETTARNTTFEIKAPKSAKPNEIIIIEIEGYKAQTQKTLINMQLELNEKRKSETLKIYAPKQNQEFHIKIPFQIPNNLDAGEREYTLRAEGLDIEKDTIITINVPREDEKDEIKITSFYTRKQKFDEEINTIINWIGSESATIRLTTQKEIKEFDVIQKTITAPLKIRKHNETIIAEIIKNNETKDVKLLRLNLEIDEDEVIYYIDEDPKENDTNKTNETEIVKEQREEIITKTTPKITNNDEEEKQKQTITAKTTTFIAENTKQTTFIILAIASLIFLFRKEITKIKNLKKN